jgi:hypothetical protein
MEVSASGEGWHLKGIRQTRACGACGRPAAMHSIPSQVGRLHARTCRHRGAGTYVSNISSWPSSVARVPLSKLLSSSLRARAQTMGRGERSAERRAQLCPAVARRVCARAQRKATQKLHAPEQAKLGRDRPGHRWNHLSQPPADLGAICPPTGGMRAHARRGASRYGGCEHCASPTPSASAEDRAPLATGCRRVRGERGSAHSRLRRVSKPSSEGSGPPTGSI